MGIVFRRRLAVPLWAVAFLTVALTAPAPATEILMPSITLIIMAMAGIAMIIFTIHGMVPLRTSRVRTLDERNQSTDALDLVRMDDDGGWQVARPPAKPECHALGAAHIRSPV